MTATQQITWLRTIIAIIIIVVVMVVIGVRLLWTYWIVYGTSTRTVGAD
jgi:uncharacterized phage infection (PIP) family protein YhgE